jgi:transposase
MDLKLTLVHAGIRQKEIADHFNISKQVVSYWINHNLPKSWELLLKQYFNSRSLKIFEKEEVKNS